LFNVGEPVDISEEVDQLDHCIHHNDIADLTVVELETKITTQDFGTQVNSGDIITPFISLLDSDKKLNTMTGIPTIDILNKLVELFKKENSDIRTHHLSAKKELYLCLLN